MVAAIIFARVIFVPNTFVVPNDINLNNFLPHSDRSLFMAYITLTCVQVHSMEMKYPYCDFHIFNEKDFLP